MLAGTKLDTGMRMNVENMARNNSNEKKLTVQGVEDAILRLKTEDTKRTNHCEEESENKDEKVHWVRHRGNSNRRPWNSRNNRGSGRGFAQNSRKRIKCYTCDEMGHYTYECPKQNSQQQQTKKQKEDVTGHFVS